MKERPILFTVEMVRAILDGRKTQTRRIVKPQPVPVLFGWELVGKKGAKTQWGEHIKDPMCATVFCPYGQPGDRLWIRETWAPNFRAPLGASDQRPYVLFRANGDGDPGQKWKPSIFMRRHSCRIVLEIIGVRLERVQSISEKDAQAEGAEIQKECPGGQWIICGPRLGSYREGYRWLWDKVNGPGSWAVNDHVWVIEFRRVTP